jgi:hypothetical protein
MTIFSNLCKNSWNILLSYPILTGYQIDTLGGIILKKMKRIIGVALSLLLLLIFISFPSATFAKEQVTDKEITLDDVDLEAGKVDMETLPKALKEKVENRIKEVDSYFADLSQAAVDYKIQAKANKKDNTKLTDAKNKYEYLYKNSESIAGLTIVPDGENVQEGTIITPYATISDVEVFKPTLYWDQWTAMYVMKGSWDWNFNPDLSPGGYDGFGLKTVQRKVSVLDSTLYTYNSSGTSTSHSYSRDASSYGVGFKFQDRSSGASYSGHAGSGFMYFKWYSGTPTGYAVNYRSTYAHSWKTTSLNGFDIGADSFGLSWDSTANRFSKENYSVVQY